MGFDNGARDGQKIRHGGHRNKNAAVIIRESCVIRRDFEIAEARSTER